LYKQMRAYDESHTKRERMKRYKEFFFITVIIFLFPSVGMCLDSLSLGGETVRLGMKKQDIRNLLGNTHQLVEMKDSSAFIVMDKSGKESIGNVYFQNDRVISVERTWPTGTTPAAFVKNFIQLFLSVNGTGTGVCSVNHRQNSGVPGLFDGDISLKCGKAKIRFGYIDYKEQFSAHLYELVEPQ
jgi:hypothetical protein